MLQHADPNQETVTIKRPMFERIAEQSDIVADCEVKLTRAANAHKDAKKAYDSSVSTLQALTNEMIRVVNGGPSDLPLFDNMSDAIERAEADPIVKTFAQRLLKHGHGDVNLLVINGYDEVQRAELTAYLDSLDANLAVVEKHKTIMDTAAADGVILDVEKMMAEHPLPEVLPVPAFLEPEAIAESVAAIEAAADGPVPTDEEVEAALVANAIELRPWHLTLPAHEKRGIVAWAAECARINDEKGENVTLDDLPNPPVYALNPPTETVTEPADEPQAEPEPADEDKPKRKRAGKFDTTIGGQMKAKKAVKKKAKK